MLKKQIALEGVEIIAPIGFYEVERIQKNTFLIDVTIEESWIENRDNDDMINTLNYEKVYHIIVMEMQVECKLMEDVAHRILTGILNLKAPILNIELSIRKKNPPLDGKVMFSKVSLHWSKD